MAAIINDRDVLLQATSPRLLQAPLPPNIVVPSDNVTGLPELFTASKSVVLQSSSLIFQVPKVGAVFPSSIAITAFLKNIVGVPTWTVIDGSATLNISGNTATITPFGMTTSAVTVQVSVTDNGVTYSDQMTVAKVVEGADGIVGLLSNESMTVPADANGNLIAGSLTSAGGRFYVFQGINDKTGTDAVTYSVVSQTGVSVSIASTGVYTVTGMSADLGTAVLRAQIADLTIDKIYSISKSRAGASGARGTVNVARAITGSVWLDSEAATALSSNGYGTPQTRDIVTLYNTSSGFSLTKFYDGTAWQTLDAYVNGNMLVTGTVAASALNVANLASIKSDLGAITAGSLSINNKFIVDSAGNTTIRSATTGARLEIKNNVIKVYDASGVLRVQLGDLSA